MCNPPFYKSADEMAQSAASKELPPNGVSWRVVFVFF